MVLTHTFKKQDQDFLKSKYCTHSLEVSHWVSRPYNWDLGYSKDKVMSWGCYQISCANYGNIED
jgi:hypothetical protein